MNIKPKFFLGLQFSSNIDFKEIKDTLYTFNQNLKAKNIGNITTVTLHKKNVNQGIKTILIISILKKREVNFDEILKLFPHLNICMRYLITDFSNENISEQELISFEQFSKIINNSSFVFFPTDSKPNCIIKGIYHQYFSLSGDIMWYNGSPIQLEKGKYYARQLYCELFLDCIKTIDGYKIPTDAIINVTSENLLPQFQNKQIILPVLEAGNSNVVAELMTNQYKVVLN